MKSFSKLNILGTLLLLVFLSSASLFQSCEEYPDAYEVSGGIPTVDYIRLPDPEVSDSLIANAFLNTTIAIIGDNLTSITAMWFNDQQAYLNTSFITSNTLLVTIPNGIPELVTDKLYMVAGSDTITYDFHVVVPAPAPTGMLCEFVRDGDIAVIKGSYFINDPKVPLEIFFPGELKANIISVSKDYKEVVVEVPNGAGVGPITVKSIYGSTRSSFFFKDDRNYILDWDNLNADGGWRAGVIGNSAPAGINGNYVRFEGDMAGAIGITWNEDALSFNLWNAKNGRSSDPLYDGDLSTAALKFECYVVEDWKASALQMIFTPYTLVDVNGYLSDKVATANTPVPLPRALWMPWANTGSYKTEGWTTVTVPMSSFHFFHDGSDAGSSVTKEMLGGLTFFVFNGGVVGEDCRVNMCIDNIRIVPM